MRIFFTNTFENHPLCKCPHNVTDDNDQIIFVGDACKSCPYCTHYEIKRSLVPKLVVENNIDDWYVQSYTHGMNQYHYKDVGFVICKHGIWDKGSLKLIFSRFFIK
jgi:hypothetical protein